MTILSRTKQQCSAGEHEWVQRDFAVSNGHRNVMTCEYCHSTRLRLSPHRPLHLPAHSLKHARITIDRV